MNFNKIKVNWLPRCATNTAFCHHKIRMLHTFGSLIITNITPSWEIVGVGRLFILVKILVKYLNFDPKTHGGDTRDGSTSAHLRCPPRLVLGSSGNLLILNFAIFQH